ncbi:hypothetical protein ACOMHN_021918 [Nucella lapillus]
MRYSRDQLLEIQPSTPNFELVNRLRELRLGVGLPRKRGCRGGRKKLRSIQVVPSRNLHPLMVPPFLQPHPDLQSAVGNAPLSSKHPTQLPTTDCLLSIIPLMGGQPSDAPALSLPSPLQQGGQSSNAPALSPPSPLPQGGQPIALALSPSSPPPQDGQPSDAPGLSPSSSTLLLCPSDSTLSICHLNSQSAVKTVRKWRMELMRLISSRAPTGSLVEEALATGGSSPLLVTFINDAFISMASNWLCHTGHLEDVHKHLLIVAMDEETKDQLHSQWLHLKILIISPATRYLHGILKFRTVGYIRLIARRVELLNKLIQAGIPVILFETDFIWYENPLPDFLRAGDRYNVDLVGTKSRVESQMMCGGFIYFRNTTRMPALFAEVLRQMWKLEVRLERQGNTEPSPLMQNEQRYLNNLLKVLICWRWYCKETMEKQWRGVRYSIVDYRRIVADGFWYRMQEHKRFDPRPKAVHNNFLTSGSDKVRRFRRFNQWVLRSDGSCDRGKVAMLLGQRNE